MPLASTTTPLRRELYNWLSARLAGGRLPFRRVDEAPAILTASGQGRPDLVLWINRESMIAGGVILLTGENDAAGLAEGAELATALGLGQFVTWGEKRITLWEATAAAPRQRTRWAVTNSEGRAGSRYAIPIELLLQELKARAVAAPPPPERLPPAYFANLCRQALRDIEPALEEAARLAGRPGMPGDTGIRARDKGWLSLWRLLALLRENRLPAAIRPELIERAILYPLSELPPPLSARLSHSRGEFPLPENASIRLHHLAVRLNQLSWKERPDSVTETLQKLAEVAARDCRVAASPLADAPDSTTLLVNHLPVHNCGAAAIVAPAPCLAALALTRPSRPGLLTAQLSDLPADFKPSRIIAALYDQQPPLPAERRRRQSALRLPWPYRRFRLPAAAPGWLWDTLHLGGMLPAAGRLEVSLPAGWADAPAAALLWQALTERLSLIRLEVEGEGRHRLTWSAPRNAGDSLEIVAPSGSRSLVQLSATAPIADLLSQLPADRTIPQPARHSRKRSTRPNDDNLTAKVFRDGLPCFPDDYLRRLDPAPLRSYQLDGPLQPGETFFDRVTLCAADGRVTEAANPIDAEALLLASCSRVGRITLPTDPVLTARLIAAYRGDLVTLWQLLDAECRRHASSQAGALARARRIWRELALPDPERLQNDVTLLAFTHGPR